MNYDEAQRVTADWNTLVARAERVRATLPSPSQDAFFQLVLWPIRASAIVNEIYVTAGLNRLYATQGRSSTNTTEDHVRELFRADAALTSRYNNELGGGRWRHFADQTHLGYTTWKDPSRNAMSAVSEIQVSERGELGVALEGCTPGWPPRVEGTKPPTLPQLDQFSHQPRVVTTHELTQKGAHVLNFWMIDPGVVLERIVVDFGGVRDSYLGPPESVRAASQSPKRAAQLVP